MLLYFLIAVSYFSAVVSLQIIEHPVSVNTTLNSTTNFSCSYTYVTGVSSFWEVNDNPIQHQLEPNYHVITKYDPTNNSIVITQLTIISSTVNNSTIFCFVKQGNSQAVKSNAALLLLQGTLDPPSQLSTQFINYTLFISWTHPFTLANVPIIGYNLFLMSTITGVNISVHYDNTTTSTQLNASLEDCTKYTITLSAYNNFGIGKETNISLVYPGVPQLLTRNDINVTVSIVQDEFHVSVSANINLNCLEQVPSSADVMLLSNGRTHDYIEIVDTFDSGQLRVEFAQVCSNEHYTVAIKLYNSVEKTLSAELANISAYDVQSIKIGRSNFGVFCVQCHFITNSTARGCLIHIYYIAEGGLQFIAKSTMKRSNDLSEWICVKSFDDNTYFNITIYDIEWDYRTSIEPAIVMTALYNSSLPVVVYFPPSVTTSHIQINIPSTIRLQYTTGITSDITSGSPTRSLHYTDTTITVNEQSSMSSPKITTTPSFSQNTSFSSTYLVVIVSTISIGIILCLGVVMICLVVTVKHQQGRLKALQHGNIATSLNPVYGIGPELIKSTDLGECPPESSSHIYNEVVVRQPDTTATSDDWIPNPTYGQSISTATTAVLYSDCVNGGTAPSKSNEEKIYDSPKHRANQVEELEQCPAYSQPPTLPSRPSKT